MGRKFTGQSQQNTSKMQKPLVEWL